jgi:hypothetical protein
VEDEKKRRKAVVLHHQVIQTKGRCDSKKNQIFRAAEILALESERKAHVKECGSLASGCP